MTERRAALALLSAAGAGILVGAAMVATRAVIEQSDPASLALMRYVLGCLCLLPPLLMLRRVRVARRDLLPICLLGIAQFGVLIVLLNWGLQYMGSARGSVIFSVMPLLTMLLGAAFGSERLSFAAGAGVVVSMLGVALSLADKLIAEQPVAGHWWGEVAVFLSALTGAVCSVLYRPYVARYPALQVGFIAMLASVAVLVLPAAQAGFFADWPRLDAVGWGCVGFIGLASGLGYFFWLWALEHTTPTRVTVFMALSPPTATVLGVVLLDERITPIFLAGLACVTAGLWLALRRPAE